jgi:hypothetical protein
MSGQLYVTGACIGKEGDMKHAWERGGGEIHGQKMVVCDTAVANPQLRHHDVTVDTAARPPCEYHWFHVSQLVLDVAVPVPLPTGQSITGGGLFYSPLLGRVPWIMAPLDAAPAVSLLPLSTIVPGIKAKIILKPRSEAAYVVNGSKMSGWVKSGS